jgi:hypothetical protein
MEMVLVPEVPDASDDERHAILVAAVDGVIVSHTSTRLSNDPDAVLARLLNGVVPSCEIDSPLSWHNTCATKQSTRMNKICFLPKGKKASLASAAPLASSPAFLKAILRLSRLFGWPLPIPNMQLFCSHGVKHIIHKFISSLAGMWTQKTYTAAEKNIPWQSQWRYS